MNNLSVIINILPRTSQYLCFLRKVNRLPLWQVNSKLYLSSNVSSKFNAKYAVGINFVNCPFLTPVSGKNTILQRKVFFLGLLQKRNFSFKDSFDSAIVTHTSVFKTLSESSVVEYAQNFIVQFHDSSGLPWWLSIIVTTFLIRSVITLPLALYQNYVIARLENVRIEMNDIVNDIKYELNREARRNKWSEEKARRHFKISVRQEWKRLIERDNCHPVKTAILAMVQIPIWLILSTSLRNLIYQLPRPDAYAQLKYVELSVGGVAWFPDLTVADSFVIPITLGLVNLAIIEVQAMMHKGKRSKFQRYMTNFFRGFAIFIIPVSATIPSCLTLYWATSSTFGLCQNLIILSPCVRRLVGIPSTPSMISHPYAHLVEQIRTKFRK